MAVRGRGLLVQLSVGALISTVILAPSALAAIDPRTVPLRSVEAPNVAFLSSSQEGLWAAEGKGADWAIVLRDPQTLSPLRSIPLGLPWGDVQQLVIDRSTAIVLSEQYLSRVDLNSGSVVSQFRINSMTDIAYDSADGYVYGIVRFSVSVPSTGQVTSVTSVQKINSVTGELVATWPIAGAGSPNTTRDVGNRLALTVDGSRLYVGLYSQGGIWVLNTDDGGIVAVGAVEPTVQSLILDEERDKVYVLTNSGLTVFNMALEAPVREANVSGISSGLMGLDKATSTLFVIGSNTGKVSVLDSETLKLRFSYPLVRATSIAIRSSSSAGNYFIANDDRVISEFNMDPTRGVPIQPLKAPANVTVKMRNLSAQIFWTGAPNARESGVIGYRARTESGTLTCATRKLTCTISGLRPGTSYKFLVQARSKKGWGPSSRIVERRTPAAIPPIASPSIPGPPIPSPSIPRPTPTEKPAAPLS